MKISDQTNQSKKIIKALRGLLDDDEREQRETFTFLKQALDEDRSSCRKLFPSKTPSSRCWPTPGA